MDHTATTPSRRNSNRRTEYIVTIAVNAVILYIVNNLTDWNLRFIMPEWESVLPLMNFSITLTILAHLAFIAYDARRFYFWMRTILDTVAIVILHRLIVVYPFDFSTVLHWPGINTVVLVGLWIGIIGTAIGLLVRSVKYRHPTNNA